MYKSPFLIASPSGEDKGLLKGEWTNAREMERGGTVKGVGRVKGGGMMKGGGSCWEAG
jgi:hypothetical protein